MSYKLNRPSKCKSSVFVNYKKNKLIIQFLNNITIAIVLSMILLFVAVDVFWGVNLPVTLPVSIIDELLMMPRALNSSQLNCSKSQSQIECSLSGNYLFGREEKVISAKQGKLLKATKKSIDILSNAGRIISRNDLLVLVTEKEKIYLYTSPSLLDEKIIKLNYFLSYSSQSNLYINVNKSYFINFWCIGDYFFDNILICIVLYLIIPILILYILSGKKYIFDKDIGKLTVVLACCRKKTLFEMQLGKIKSIRLDKIIEESGEEDSEDYRKEEFYKVSIIDVDYKSYFIPILFIGIESRELEAHKIADAICLFLNLGTYATIEGNRSFFDFLPRLWG